MKNIIFIAPPAAGKGTVSDYLVKNYDYSHLSTGDLLREEIKSGSSLGKEIEQLISTGKLVSDEVIIKLVQDKLANLDIKKPFILDGFPRTIIQAKKLDQMLISSNVTNNVVIYLDIDIDKALKRVMGRIICSNCSRSYNLNTEALKPRVENICDDCGGKLEKRTDDTEETFKVRFNTYLENTTPILDYYRSNGMLETLEVSDDLSKLLDEVVKIVSDDKRGGK